MAWWRIIIWAASVLLSAFNNILSCEFRGRHGHKFPKQSDLSGPETVDELQPVFSIAPSPGLFFGCCQGGRKQSNSREVNKSLIFLEGKSIITNSGAGPTKDFFCKYEMRIRDHLIMERVFLWGKAEQEKNKLVTLPLSIQPESKQEARPRSKPKSVTERLWEEERAGEKRNIQESTLRNGVIQWWHLKY